MIESKVVTNGNLEGFLKGLVSLSKTNGKKRKEYTKECCLALITTEGAMIKRAFGKTVDSVTGASWQRLTFAWREVRKALKLNNQNILKFGFKYKKGAKRNAPVNKRYRNVNTKGILYESIKYKVVRGDGYIGSNIPYAKKHNRGLNGMPQRRFLGVGKPDFKFFKRVLDRMLKKIESDNKK